MAIKCPRCGEINKDGSAECWSCLMPFEPNVRAEIKTGPPEVRPVSGEGMMGKTVKLPAFSQLFINTIELIRIDLFYKLFSGSKEKKTLVYISLIFLLLSAVNNILYFITANDSVYAMNAGMSLLDMTVLLVYLFLAGFLVYWIVKGNSAGMKRIYAVVLAVLAVMASAYIPQLYHNHVRLMAEFAILLVLVVMLWAYKEHDGKT
jgi:hypothetical protein